jgi:hypothetical protein
LVYLVQLDQASRDLFNGRLVEHGVTPLDDAELEAQSSRLVAALLPLRREKGIKLVPYLMDKQAATGP